MGGAGTSVPPVLLEPPLELLEEELLDELLLDEEELPLDPVLLPVLPKLDEPPDEEELPLDEELLLLDPLDPLEPELE
ncbi:hypothetical protein SAMN05518866_12417 [Sphingobium sp. YR768]|jgi:hypothetical protein|nr:hypothetical protein SAMN05518866_12417 [Sphingobium sp. YR768]